MSLDKKIAALVAEQLPDYVRQDHPAFVAFLEAYYEWLAIDGNAEERLKHIPLNQDIDTTLDEFIEFFTKEFLVRIPQDIITNKRELSKHIKEYYRARGTEKSYKLLFRIMFNSDVEFYYPHIDMLRVSDGKWQQDRTLKIQSISGKGDPKALEARTIIGKTSKASAIVDKILKYYIGPYEVNEFFLNRSSILGKFVANEVLYSKEVANVEGRIYPIVTGIQIDVPGSGYLPGEIITFSGGSGLQAAAEVKSVDSATGAVRTIKMTNYGVGYDIAPTCDFTPGSVQASGTPIIGAMTDSDGYYLNQDGQVSSSKRIQDSYFYQQFSYVLFVQESIEKYREIIKQLLHPAGLIMFGGVRSINEVDVTTRIPSLSGSASSYIIRQQVGLLPNPGIVHGDTRYASSEVMDMRVNQGNFSEDLPREVVIIQTIAEEGPTVFRLGASLRSIERDKFKFIPSDGNEDASQMVGVNAGYWDDYGNEQIGDFDDMVIGDFEDVPYERTNIQPEPILRSKF